MFELDMLSYLMGKKAGGPSVEQVEGTVALDFSDGDMVVLPDDGKAFSKVTVEQPETLIAENIAEGVNIAGIVGALAAGGGASSAVCEFISLESADVNTSGATTIPHNLGVVPDVVIASADTSSGANKMYRVVGYSSAFIEKYFDADAYYNLGFNVRRNSADTMVSSIASTAIDVSGTSCAHSATETTISVGGSSTPMVSGSWYIILIGGLT